jgi:AAA domain
MADHVLAVMEASRSTWQMWHVRAEAQRQVRPTGVTAERASALVDLLVDEVLDRRSVALVAAPDNIREPEVLRRVDGSSVYTVAGAALYTSQRILDAEQRLLTTAGRRDGSAVDDTAVDLALLEMAANGSILDAGQASLVWQMCTSGARLQLAIAPAGAGKTTAMRALALAWSQDGGQVIGLAPSAAATAVLGEQTGIRADTLAKLTWSLDHRELPDRAAAVDSSTLLIIDEAGMADTLSLDTTVQFAVSRGASVRLVGDDQQLAAIGAGGILRDITHTYGALQLTELHRFADPAEAAATLALREGKPQALNFYLDHGRVHVGDIATTTQNAFAAWVSDRAAGLDAIMLAPTRNLVNELNRQARDHLLGSHPAGREVRLADGNQASVGDVIITRSNAPHTNRLGQKRRPLDHHPRRQTRRPGCATQPQPPDRPAPSRLRPHLNRSRLRHHHPRRPRRYRRHHARPSHRTGIPTAAVYDAHPRPDRESPLPAGPVCLPLSGLRTF